MAKRRMRSEKPRDAAPLHGELQEILDRVGPGQYARASARWFAEQSTMRRKRPRYAKT